MRDFAYFPKEKLLVATTAKLDSVCTVYTSIILDWMIDDDLILTAEYFGTLKEIARKFNIRNKTDAQLRTALRECNKLKLFEFSSLGKGKYRIGIPDLDVYLGKTIKPGDPIISYGDDEE